MVVVVMVIVVIVMVVVVVVVVFSSVACLAMPYLALEAIVSSEKEVFVSVTIHTITIYIHSSRAHQWCTLRLLWGASNQQNRLPPPPIPSPGAETLTFELPVISSTGTPWTVTWVSCRGG